MSSTRLLPLLSPRSMRFATSSKVDTTAPLDCRTKRIRPLDIASAHAATVLTPRSPINATFHGARVISRPSSRGSTAPATSNNINLAWLSTTRSFPLELNYMRVTTSPSSPLFNHDQNPIFCSAIITSSPSSSRSSSPLSFGEGLSSTGPSCLRGPASSILKVTNAKVDESGCSIGSPNTVNMSEHVGSFADSGYFWNAYSKSDEERMDKLIDDNVGSGKGSPDMVDMSEYVGYSFDTFDECDEKRITGIIAAAERRLELRKIEKAYRERENRQEIKKDIEQPRLFRLGLNLDNDRPIPDCEIPAWYRVRPATRAQRDPLTLLPGPLQLWPHHMYDTVLHRHLLKQRARKPEHRTLGILEMIGEKDKHGFGRCKDFRLQTPAMCDHEKYDVPTFPPVPPAEHVTVPSFDLNNSFVHMPNLEVDTHRNFTAGLVDDPDGYVSTYNTKGCPFGVIGDRRTSVLYGVIGDGRPSANANPANTDVTPISTIAHPTPLRGPVYTAAELHEDSKNGNTTPSPVSSQGLITPKMPACNFCSAVGDVPINVTQAKAGSNARTFDIESFTRRLARTRMLHAEAL